MFNGVHPPVGDLYHLIQNDEGRLEREGGKREGERRGSEEKEKRDTSVQSGCINIIHMLHVTVQLYYMHIIYIYVIVCS